jgi:glycosyltransferase involved in cell wall biosynthesis
MQLNNPGRETTMSQLISIILPVYDEGSDSLGQLLDQLIKVCTTFNNTTEIIIVDDGSKTPVSAPEGVQVIRHPYNMGNGAAVKTGARNAKGDIMVFMDADRQHSPDDIQQLLSKLDKGYDMVVGARRSGSQAGYHRAVGNRLYNRLASWMTGCRIEDLTSGFRAVRADKFKKFLYLLPNGFSYPTTITMAFFRSAYPVAYVPIHVGTRQGRSNISLMKDGVRFLIIILRIGALFSPMRLFLPVSLVFFFVGLFYYSYTYLAYHRLTIMSALLFIASMLTFLIGIVSEQISSLHYRGNEDK